MVSSPKLYGTVTIDRQIAMDEYWVREPFTRAQAWLDLWLLANDADRVALWRGVPVPVKRGQLARSATGLGERWHWSAKKVRVFLEELRDLRKINYKTSNLATIITVLDYDVYNTKERAEAEAEVEAEGQPEAPAEVNAEEHTGNAEGNAEVEAEGQRNLGTLELRNRNLGTWEGPTPAKNAVSKQQAIEWCRKNQSGYSDEEVAAAWNGLNAVAVDGLWTIGGRPVSDWRCALTDECWKRRQIYGKKNSAPTREREADEPPRLKVTPLTLDAMR